MENTAAPLLSGKSSVECSQDISHIILSSFHKYSLHDLDSELVSNILAAKGSKDTTQESYVEALESIKGEFTQNVSTISQLERHIMHAQTRVVSAKEKHLLSHQISGDVFSNKVKSSLRDCLDPDLLQNNNLVSPNDFFHNAAHATAAPKASTKPNYLKSLSRGDGGSKEATRNILIAWEDEGVELDDHVEMEETSVAKVDGADGKKLNSERGKNRPEEFWKDHTNVEKRNAEKFQLDMLLKKTEGKKNPRFVKSSEATRSRSLVRVYGPGQRPQDPSLLPPIFVPTPAIIFFSSYEPGKVYEAILELRNVSAVLQSCRVTPPKSGYFGINLGEFPSESSLVAPGMACLFRIRFLPDALCEFEDSLTVHIPDRPTMALPLIGRRTPPILSLPGSIDIGECLVAANKVVSIKVVNKGGEGKFCILPKHAWPCASLKQAMGSGISQRSLFIGDCFSVFPGTFRLKPKEEVTLQFIFTPSDTRRYFAEFVIICDNCHVRSFSVYGEGARLQFDIEHIDGGVYAPQTTDYVDAFSTSHIAFPALNLGMAFDKRIRIRNARQIDIPFAWAVVKPYLVAPIPPLQLETSIAESDSARVTISGPTGPKLPDCRIIEEESVFSIEPLAGIFRAGETAEFMVSYLPDRITSFHSVLHLIIPSVPQVSGSSEQEQRVSSGVSDSSGVSSTGSTSESGARSTKSNQSVNIADVTALEIDLRGSCESYNLSLNPCAIFMDGETLIRTSSRHTFYLRNDSYGPAAFEWQPIADDDAIIEVEPKIGVLEPGAVAVLTAIVTGTRAGKVVKQIPCWVEFCPKAICLQLEANFKGPECVFKEENGSEPLRNKQLAYLDFGLLRSTSVGLVQFNITNTSGIDTCWNLTYLARLDGEDEQNGTEEDGPKELLSADEINFSSTSGTLLPLSSQKIDMKLNPQLSDSQLGPRTGFVRLDVSNGRSKIVQVFADIQRPDVCLMSSELSITESIFVDTVAREAVYLINKTNLSTEFEWQTNNIRFSENSTCRACVVEIDPPCGVIGSKERLAHSVAVKPLEVGTLEAFVTCDLPEIGEKLVLFIRAAAVGLDVTYSVFESALTRTPSSMSRPRSVEPVESKSVDFGGFKLAEVVRRQLVIRNKTKIPANFQLSVTKFRPPADVLRSTQEQDMRRTLMSSDVKAVSEMRTRLLSNELGLAVITVPSTGHLPGEGTAVVEVFAVADMWGHYYDEIVSRVGDLPPHSLSVEAQATGSPLLFQMMIAQRHKTAMCRFGVAVQGTTPITKKLRLLNEGPCDIRLDWRLYQVKKGDPQFVDFLHYVLDAFPVNKDTTTTSSRQQAEKRTPESEVSADDTVEEDKQLVSCVLRKHEGVPADEPAIFAVNPSQIVIKGRSHATIEVTLDPRQVPALAAGERFVNLDGYGLAYVSLTDDVRRPRDGSVERIQWYDADTVRLSITAQVQPAVLTMDTVDEDALSMLLAASTIIPKSLYADIEAHSNNQPCVPVGSKRKPVSLRFFNYHETELKLTAEILAPFKIVYFGSALRKSFIDRPTNKTPEISLPAHDTLIVRIDVETGMSMLDDLDSLVPNLAVVDGRYLTLSSTDHTRSVHFRRFFVIRFSNDVSQSVRLSCAIPLPLLVVAKKRIDFPVTMVGKSRDLSFDAVNCSDSDTWLQCHVETESDADRGCFRVRPTGSRVGPTVGRRVTLDVTFTPRHEGLHTAQVIVLGKILGERFIVELSGAASYDEKYAL